MRCPRCGDAVIVRGSQWECGRCGNFGNLERTLAQQPAQITLTFSWEYDIDLPKKWAELKAALAALAPDRSDLPSLLGKVLLHNISAGIHHAGALPEGEKAEKLRTFLESTPDLDLGKSAEEMMRSAERAVLFQAEGTLSETECGAFWTELISSRPVEEYYNNIDPKGMYDLHADFAAAFAYFGGKQGEEMGEAQSRQNAMEEAYHAHLQDAVLLHPDIDRAKRFLSEGRFPEYEDICREILLVEYPEEVPHETAEDLLEWRWPYSLEETFSCDIDRGIEMWRYLLDIAEPVLKDDPKTAEELLPSWDWANKPDPDQVSSLLAELRDERFQSQLFHSASIGGLQRDILNICHTYGQEELGRHCLELALGNPYLEKNWEKRFKEIFFGTRPKRRTYTRVKLADTGLLDTETPETGLPDDGTIFQYCSVQIPGVRRPYSYLTGGLPLKVKDWVEVPFGQDDTLRQGQVEAVVECTRTSAPWPPEQTKAVLRQTDAPPIEMIAEAAAPKLERHIEPVAGAAAPKPKVEERREPPKKALEKPERPAPAAQPAAPRRPEAEGRAPAAQKQDKKKDAAERKPFPLKKVLAAVLAAAVIAEIALLVVHQYKQNVSTYETAIQEMSQGDYAAAEQRFSSLSGYRDAEPLAVYCKYAGLYQDRTDYAGGLDELASISLQYDTDWQKDVDVLESRVVYYRIASVRERQAAVEEAVKWEQSRKKQYSGRLPVKGMPMSCLKYTSLGAPDKEVKCRDFDRLVENHRSISVYWYGSNGKVLAAGTCYKREGDSEFMLYTFSYYPPSSLDSDQTGHSGSGSSGGTSGSGSSGNSGSGHSGSIRDDYDNPEDLWEDNQDWYEDEDEAWDEWYDD